MLAKVEYIEETDEFILILPNEIIEQFHVQPGDEIYWEDLKNGTFKLTFLQSNGLILKNNLTIVKEQEIIQC